MVFGKAVVTSWTHRITCNKIDNNIILWLKFLMHLLTMITMSNMVHEPCSSINVQ